MITHAFIFQPGKWEGEGEISLSMSEDVFPYQVAWTVYPQENGSILFHQAVDVKELGQKMINHFCVKHVSSGHFQIELTNELVRCVQGKGIADTQLIAWEFRHQSQDFEGFEAYHLQSDCSYMMHGEYAGVEGMRTYIKGYIRRLESK